MMTNCPPPDPPVTSTMTALSTPRLVSTQKHSNAAGESSQSGPRDQSIKVHHHFTLKETRVWVKPLLLLTLLFNIKMIFSLQLYNQEMGQ